ncbi:FMN-binding protein [Dactylosporangium sp. NPDC000555]|uniref:FMN-binding protein n=1 Tax=Dactylosporangium sp. NPDC000555 TaxID=3154260 RepID=UPI0033237163
MRRLTMWFAGTAAVIALLFNYRTSTMGPARPVPAAAAPGAGTPGVVAQPSDGDAPDHDNQPSPSSSADPGGGAPPPPSPGTVTRSGSVLVANGSAVSTMWGPVQVQVRIDSGRITDVTALQAPGGFSRELTALAVPRLRSQALASQSAHIDAVSGATQTSEAYRTSLQAALDATHFQAPPGE